MSLLRAILRALDETGTAPGQGGAVPQPPPPSAPAPLGPVVEALAARVAGLEASLAGAHTLAKQEADRAVRAAESAGRAVRRLRDELQGSSSELDTGDDVPGDDARAGAREWVQPMRPGLVAPEPVQREPTDAEIRAAVQRSLKLRA